jgi:hypothetical protein
MDTDSDMDSTSHSSDEISLERLEERELEMKEKLKKCKEQKKLARRARRRAMYALKHKTQQSVPRKPKYDLAKGKKINEAYRIINRFFTEYDDKNKKVSHMPVDLLPSIQCAFQVFKEIPSDMVEPFVEHLVLKPTRERSLAQKAAFDKCQAARQQKLEEKKRLLKMARDIIEANGEEEGEETSQLDLE